MTSLHAHPHARLMHRRPPHRRAHEATRPAAARGGRAAGPGGPRPRAGGWDEPRRAGA